MSTRKLFDRLGLRPVVALGLLLTVCACSVDDDRAVAEAATRLSQAERAARALLANLTLEQKVGQMIQGEISEVTPEDLRKYGTR